MVRLGWSSFKEKKCIVQMVYTIHPNDWKYDYLLYDAGKNGGVSMLGVNHSVYQVYFVFTTLARINKVKISTHINSQYQCNISFIWCCTKNNKMKGNNKQMNITNNLDLIYLDIIHIYLDRYY